MRMAKDPCSPDAVNLSVPSIIIYDFKHSYYPGSYLDERQYVRQIVDHYEAVERRFAE